LGQHQLGPNGKIYLSHRNEINPQDSADFYRSVIQNPNQSGVNCNFEYLQLYMAGRRGDIHLPNLPNYNLGPLHAQTAEAGPSHLICPGDSVQLGYPDTTGGLVSFTWTDGVGSLNPPLAISDASIPQPWARPDTTTWYYLQVVDSAYGIPCGMTWDSVQVRVALPEEQPEAMAGVDTIFCPGGAAPLGAADSAVSGWNYAWTPAFGVAAPSAPATTTQAPGTYVLSVSNPIAAGSCFSDWDTVIIAQYDPSVIPANLAGPDAVICAGDTVQLGVANAPSGWNYRWSSPGVLDEAARPDPRAFPDATTNFVVSASDDRVALPCAVAVDSVTVTVEQPFTHPLPAPVVRFCPGECITIGVAPQPGFEYAWSPTAGLDDPNASMTRARPNGTTTYTLTVTDPRLQSSNCRRQVYTVVATADNCHFPTLLWPNGDGIAETLDFGEYAARVELTVYDLQGRRVYASEDYGSDWRGEELAAGMYGYRMTVTGECGFAREGKFLKMQ
ncbi:MAG: gliding motility-associated C-terminal domain-containing protein, partial [Bacteroidota bacterium]